MGARSSTPPEGSNFPAYVPTVAVIVTTYNDPEFLADALASVVAQTRLPDEILVVDDGSVESPESIVAAFPTARLIRKQNGGLSSARNAGWRASSASHVTFLDADDRFTPQAVQAGLDGLEEHPEAAMVYGGHRRIQGDGRPVGPDHVRGIGPDPYADLLTGNHIGMHATVLYRREVLQALGGFDEGLRRCEDYDLYLRVARTYPITWHRQIIAEYRWHGRNMSAETGAMLRSALAVLDRHKDQTGARKQAWRTGRRFWKSWYTTGQRAHWGGEEVGNMAVQRPKGLMGAAIRRIKRRLSAGILHRLAVRIRGTWPPPLGTIDFGHLGATRPISLDFGWDRGTPVDRYYLERFLELHAGDIRGRVLEVGDDAYSRRFGQGRVTKQDVLHVQPDYPNATIVGDLTHPGVLPADTFDCIVLTQTLQYIFDLEMAVERLHAALKPGGVLLLTAPGISQLDRNERAYAWCWGFTTVALGKLFARRFKGETLRITTCGNVFAAVALLEGAVLEEVDRAKLDVEDSAYPVVLTVRAQKL